MNKLDEIVIDARPIIATGGEPFGAIMDAVGRLQADQTLIVLAPFDPVPLEGVLGEQGFDFEVEETAPGDWRVRFTRAAG